MKYTAILNGKERQIEVKKIDIHRFKVTVDGNIHEVDAQYNNSDWISILIDNRSYDISFSFDKDTVELNFWNQYFNIDVLDERKIRMRRIRSELSHSGPEIIKTSMPGKVIKVLVKKGETVKPGTGIIIIEAMKMENEIQCRHSGVIKAIHARAGETIEADIPLVEIAPDK